MRRLLIAAMLFLAAFPIVAEGDLPPSVALAPELDRVLRDYEKAWMAGDAAGLAALFTEDGFVLSNGKPPVRGRAAIRAAYAQAGGPLVLRAMAYSVDGSTGYIIGAYGSSKDKPDIGKFVLALRRVDGRWLIAADMDNVNTSSRPAPAPAPAPAP
jgi:ketosteroid isomerase-like protein